MNQTSTIELIKTIRLRAARYLPFLQWVRTYNLTTLSDDALAAVIVTIMLVPQSLAYAMLAGLPPQVGLYASVFPLLAYAIFGTSRTLAVGPVAVVSLMTAAAIGQLGVSGKEYIAAALVLSLLSGLMLITMGLLRLGFIANFLSHPVVSGFITASGILIATSQLNHLLGVEASGQSLIAIVRSIFVELPSTNLPTLLLGGTTLAFLLAIRTWLKNILINVGVRARVADIAVKIAPIVAVVATTFASAILHLSELGVRIVGSIPQTLPSLTIPSLDFQLWLQLGGAAALISLIGFVESTSVAQTLAAKRRERIDPNQEFIALGAANVVAALGSGYPVTGGFARSIVNFEAGAQTPAAGALTALGIGFATLFLTPYLYYLPQATLAATIIAAVLSLVDFDVLRRTWAYSKQDFAAVAATISITLVVGVEAGVVAGVVISLGLFLYRTSRPHIAVIGLVPGTEHFRNVLRHQVLTSPHILGLRVDESLYFANARFLEEVILSFATQRPKLRHVVLMCSAVNEIDASALESLKTINSRLKDLGVTFNFSEVKGPVMDKLQKTDLLNQLTGSIFISHYAAIKALETDAASSPGALFSYTSVGLPSASVVTSEQ